MHPSPCPTTPVLLLLVITYPTLVFSSPLQYNIRPEGNKAMAHECKENGPPATVTKAADTRKIVIGQRSYSKFLYSLNHSSVRKMTEQINPSFQLTSPVFRTQSGLVCSRLLQLIPHHQVPGLSYRATFQSWPSIIMPPKVRSVLVPPILPNQNQPMMNFMGLVPFHSVAFKLFQRQCRLKLPIFLSALDDKPLSPVFILLISSDRWIHFPFFFIFLSPWSIEMFSSYKPSWFSPWSRKPRLVSQVLSRSHSLGYFTFKPQIGPPFLFGLCVPQHRVDQRRRTTFANLSWEIIIDSPGRPLRKADGSYHFWCRSARGIPVCPTLWNQVPYCLGSLFPLPQPLSCFCALLSPFFFFP